MRRFYTFLFSLCLVLSGISQAIAADVNIKLVIDDVNRVKVSLNGTVQENLTTGENLLAVAEYTYMNIETTDDNFLTEVSYASEDGSVSGLETIYNMSRTSRSIYASLEGYTWTITSAPANDLRDGYCTIMADNPANVVVRRSETYSTVSLEGETTTVRYIKSKELPLMIQPTGPKPLYEVSVNDQVLPFSNSMYTVTPKTAMSSRLRPSSPIPRSM